MKTKVYALGLGKGWVEIRRALKAPTCTSATIAKDVVRREQRYDATTYGYHWMDVPKTFRMKVTSFKGGQVLGVVRTRTFGKIAGANCLEGGVLEIPEEMVGKLLTAKTVRRGGRNG